MGVGTFLFWAAIIVGAYFLFRGKSGGGQVQPAGEIHGPGKFEFEIVGESHYQSALRAIAGPKQQDGVEHHCTAVLVLDDHNAHDSNAVRVDIEGRTVGYLARPHAREYRKQVSVASLSVPAVIVGGWNRGGGDTGHYGVKLDLPLVK